jgi:hypothetical protein
VPLKQSPPDSPAMADSTDLNLDAPSDLQDIPDSAMELIPPPEGTFPDKSVAHDSLSSPMVKVGGNAKASNMC